MKFNRVIELGQKIKSNILNEAKHPFTYLNDEAQQVAQSIATELNIPIEDFIAGTKRTIIILSDDRSAVFSGLEKMGFEKNAVMTGSSAGGFVSPEGINVINKPKTLSLLGGSGIDNEQIFYKAVKQALDTRPDLTINFVADNKTVSIENVSDVTHIGKEGERKGWKGDVNIISSGDVNNHISIKKDGGFRWESVMTRYRDVFIAFMTKAKAGEIENLHLTPDDGNPRLLRMLDDNGKPYSRVIINNHPGLDPSNPDNDIYDMAFGKDDALIVQRSFTESDFELNGEVLTIKASKIQQSLDDFEPSDFPMIEFERNASKATKTDGIYGRGIIPRTTPLKQRGGKRSNILDLEYDDLMS
jgi:hypothetical protein